MTSSLDHALLRGVPVQRSNLCTIDLGKARRFVVRGVLDDDVDLHRNSDVRLERRRGEQDLRAGR
jgi:hypothetical protein